LFPNPTILDKIFNTASSQPTLTNIVTTQDVEQANTSNKWRTEAVEEKGSKHRAAAKGEQQQQVERKAEICPMG